MQRAYWNCEVQKNWDGSLRDDMLCQNIVCFGKPRSGKTEKVAKPFMRKAIELGASIILAINNRETDYDDIFREAQDAGYEIYSHEPLYYPEHSTREIERKAASIMRKMMAEKILMYVYPDKEKKGQVNTVSYMPAMLYAMEHLEENEEIEFDYVSMVIEDADWELTLPAELHRCGWLNFCITTGCRQMSMAALKTGHLREVRLHLLRDQEETDRSALYEELHSKLDMPGLPDMVSLLDANIESPKDYKQLRNALTDAKLSSLIDLTRDRAEECSRFIASQSLPVELSSFFQDVETVVCTGLSDIAPHEAKDFLRQFVVAPGYAPPGGKFLITDLVSPWCPAPRSVIPKTVMRVWNKWNAEELLMNGMTPGACVLEQNGILKMYASPTGEVLPMMFLTAAQAMSWVEFYFLQMGWGWPEPAEMDLCSVRYILPTVNEHGKPDEFMISYIQPEDGAAYAEQALLVLMEVEEYLKTPAKLSLVPGVDRSKEAANVTMQKLVDYVCQTYCQPYKPTTTELPVDQETQTAVASMLQQYQWRPYQKPVSVSEEALTENAMDILPQKNILFLGGHANMVKKLRQTFPGWTFLTDDELGSWTGGDCEVIFFWSKHCSHKVMQYVNARKSKQTPYIYVVSTNIERLINEMAQKYKDNATKRNCLITV